MIISLQDFDLIWNFNLKLHIYIYIPNVNELKYHSVNRNGHKSLVSRNQRVKACPSSRFKEHFLSPSSTLLPSHDHSNIRFQASRLENIPALTAFVSVPKFTIKLCIRVLPFHESFTPDSRCDEWRVLVKKILFALKLFHRLS